MTFFNFLLLFFFLIFLLFLTRIKIQLSSRILFALLLGILYGFLLKLSYINWIFIFNKEILFFIGQAYLILLKMLVIPLIVSSIVYTITNFSTNNINTIKRISLWSCGILLLLTMLASLIGILVGKLFSVGSGLYLPSFMQPPAIPTTNLVNTLLSMLPSNPIAIMTQENTIALVLFSILLGIAARLVEGQTQDMEIFRHGFAGLFAAIKKLTSMILNLTPYGIFALMSLLLLDQGFLLISGVLKFMVAMYVAMFLLFALHSLILYCIGINPIQYFKKSFMALFVAFTTRSSFGTLPVTEETLRNQFKLNQSIATVVPSIGATIGMNACAGIFPAMLVVMVLTITQQPLTLQLICTVMVMNALASLGLSGIPGTAYIAATVTLINLNLPYSVIALVQGIDPIVDMGRTAANVNGVMTTALVVNRLQTTHPH